MTILKNFLFVFMFFILVNCNSKTEDSPSFVWGIEQKQQYLQYRSDSTKWSNKNWENDIKNIDFEGDPMVYGVFPTPDYDLIDSTFAGIGTVGEFKGLKWEGKTILHKSFYVNSCQVNQDYVKNRSDEVYFTIITLTDTVDLKRYTHMRADPISRNHPDYVGQGYFKTKTNKIDYLTFLTADRDNYAIINLRLFDLAMGRTVLIAPQKDGSLRSLQLLSPILSSKEVDAYIQNILSQKEVLEFFTNKRVI